MTCTSPSYKFLLVQQVEVQTLHIPLPRPAWEENHTAVDFSQNVQKVASPKYTLAWVGVDSEFYKQKNIVTEAGMYGYDYSTYYESGPVASWLYDQTEDRLGYLE
mgnify:CR=1 FL=1